MYFRFIRSYFPQNSSNAEIRTRAFILAQCDSEELQTTQLIYSSDGQTPQDKQRNVPIESFSRFPNIILLSGMFFFSSVFPRILRFPNSEPMRRKRTITSERAEWSCQFNGDTLYSIVWEDCFSSTGTLRLSEMNDCFFSSEVGVLERLGDEYVRTVE